MNLIKKSADVYIAHGPIAAIGCEEVDFLRRQVAASPRGRLRINLHPESADLLHEMFIAIRSDSYIRPHRHPGKSESFHIVHGEVDIVVFDDEGNIKQVVPMAAAGGAKAFYYRMSKPFFHTLVIRSDVLIVHEITNGPFVEGASMFGAFAPEEDAGIDAISLWMSDLAERARTTA